MIPFMSYILHHTPISYNDVYAMCLCTISLCAEKNSRGNEAGAALISKTVTLCAVSILFLNCSAHPGRVHTCI